MNNSIKKAIEAKSLVTKPTVGNIMPHYGRYGRDGWTGHITGLTPFFAHTKGEVNEWMKSHGCENYDGARRRK